MATCVAAVSARVASSLQQHVDEPGPKQELLELAYFMLARQLYDGAHPPSGLDAFVSRCRKGRFLEHVNAALGRLVAAYIMTPTAKGMGQPPAPAAAMFLHAQGLLAVPGRPCRLAEWLPPLEARHGIAVLQHVLHPECARLLLGAPIVEEALLQEASREPAMVLAACTSLLQAAGSVPCDLPRGPGASGSGEGVSAAPPGAATLERHLLFVTRMAGISVLALAANEAKVPSRLPNGSSGAYAVTPGWRRPLVSLLRAYTTFLCTVPLAVLTVESTATWLPLSWNLFHLYALLSPPKQDKVEVELEVLKRCGLARDDGVWAAVSAVLEAVLPPPPPPPTMGRDSRARGTSGTHNVGWTCGGSPPAKPPSAFSRLLFLVKPPYRPLFDYYQWTFHGAVHRLVQDMVLYDASHAANRLEDGDEGEHENEDQDDSPWMDARDWTVDELLWLPVEARLRRHRVPEGAREYLLRSSLAALMPSMFHQWYALPAPPQEQHREPPTGHPTISTTGRGRYLPWWWRRADALPRPPHWTSAQVGEFVKACVEEWGPRRLSSVLSAYLSRLLGAPNWNASGLLMLLPQKALVQAAWLWHPLCHGHHLAAHAIDGDQRLCLTLTLSLQGAHHLCLQLNGGSDFIHLLYGCHSAVEALSQLVRPTGAAVDAPPGVVINNVASAMHALLTYTTEFVHALSSSLRGGVDGHALDAYWAALLRLLHRLLRAMNQAPATAGAVPQDPEASPPEPHAVLGYGPMASKTVGVVVDMLEYVAEYARFAERQCSAAAAAAAPRAADGKAVAWWQPQERTWACALLVCDLLVRAEEPALQTTAVRRAVLQLLGRVAQFATKHPVQQWRCREAALAALCLDRLQAWVNEQVAAGAAGATDHPIEANKQPVGAADQSVDVTPEPHCGSGEGVTPPSEPSPRRRQKRRRRRHGHGHTGESHNN